MTKMMDIVGIAERSWLGRTMANATNEDLGKSIMATQFREVELII